MIAMVNSHPDFFKNRSRFIHDNIQDQILAFERDGLFFVFSFNPTNSYEGYGIAMPEGEYKIVLNNDSPKYGGLNRIDESLSYFSLPVEEGLYSEHYLKMYIPNHTVLVFEKVH